MNRVADIADSFWDRVFALGDSISEWWGRAVADRRRSR